MVGIRCVKWSWDMPVILALEKRGLRIQGHSQLHSKFMASLGYMILYLKNKQKLWSPFSGKYRTEKREQKLR